MTTSRISLLERQTRVEQYRGGVLSQQELGPLWAHNGACNTGEGSLKRQVTAANY